MVNPHLKLVIGYRGLMVQSMGRPEEALPDLYRSSRADPNDPQVPSLHLTLTLSLSLILALLLSIIAHRVLPIITCIVIDICFN